MSWRSWIRTVEIVPSLSEADPALVEGQVESLLRAGCRIFHLDVDADSVGRIDAIAPLVHRWDGVLDVHLSDGASALDAISRGADSITVALDEGVDAAWHAARNHDRQFGVVFPASEPAGPLPVDHSAIDLVSVAVDRSTESIVRVREIARALPGVAVQVEGDVSHDNLAAFYAVGATVFVVGRPIFEREDMPRTYRRLVQALA